MQRIGRLGQVSARAIAGAASTAALLSNVRRDVFSMDTFEHVSCKASTQG
jgi:hypothetical protein